MRGTPLTAVGPVGGTCRWNIRKAVVDWARPTVPAMDAPHVDLTGYDPLLSSSPEVTA